MAISLKSASLIGAAFVLLGASVDGAAALPMMAPVGPSAAGVERAAYLHRRYPGDHGRAARMFRHARRNAPNDYCRNQPSRCR